LSKNLSRDINVMYKMVDHIKSMKDGMKRLGCKNKAELMIDKQAMDLSAFYVAQIGELSKVLTDGTRKELRFLNDKTAILLRNKIDHNYEKVSRVMLAEYIMKVCRQDTGKELADRIKYCRDNAIRK